MSCIVEILHEPQVLLLVSYLNLQRLQSCFSNALSKTSWPPMHAKNTPAHFQFLKETNCKPPRENGHQPPQFQIYLLQFNPF